MLQQMLDYQTALEEDIRMALTLYFNLGMNDKEISMQMTDHYDTDIYGLGCIQCPFLCIK
jgi:hypothetical protein